MFFNYTSILKLIATYKIARKKYAEKKNIQLFLKNKLKKTDVIKISYDTQSGDYIKYFNKLPQKKIEKIYYPLVKAINNNFFFFVLFTLFLFFFFFLYINKICKVFC